MLITYEENKETYKTDYIFNIVNILNHMEEIEGIETLSNNQHIINEFINHLINIHVFYHERLNYSLKYEVFNTIKNQLNKTNLNLTFLELVNELMEILEMEIKHFKYTQQSIDYKKYIISCYLRIHENTTTYRHMNLSIKYLKGVIKQ